MRFAQYGLVALLFAVCVGCNSTQVEVVDLNKVLDIFTATMTELDGQNADKGEAAVAEVSAENENAENREQFMDLYAVNLNKAKLISSSVGVEMAASGDIHGFKDANSNKTRDSGEKDLFKIQVDAGNNRLIASDNANHYRDHSYRPRGGFFMGYMIGSMMGRNRSYYSGSRSSMKPDFSKTKMSPKSYHASAVSKARSKARSSSARSRSGSRGTSFGK